MKVSKAIEILTLNLPTDHWNRDLDQLQALKLGIEALKWVKRYRPRNKTDNWSLLPGETED